MKPHKTVKTVGAGKEILTVAGQREGRGGSPMKAKKPHVDEEKDKQLQNSGLK
eukprot:CAMPEP_0179972360 /NCGR_PEP_ID=MMETSP0983-20121128/36631_1 /TAXON_ID=483367 /ORGANISM="non described non described, Strain CCMP 2436" /LENGTH=52 /DNA_ID=CAMNT_0021887769 /DNA_START=80 /DNA_END=235 /DNA_ORIENTATION=-